VILGAKDWNLPFAADPDAELARGGLTRWRRGEDCSRGSCCRYLSLLLLLLLLYLRGGRVRRVWGRRLLS
jgi:hypothetical protein